MIIEKMDNQGRGIGYLNNKIVFVPNTLVGEEVDIEIVKDKKNYSEGRVLKYLKTSVDRIDALCPYYELCGGCDLQHLTYQNQLKYKQNKIENILKLEVNNIISSEQFNYRNKITLKVDNHLGYYKKQSHEIVSIDNCLIADEKINCLITKINQLDLSKIEEVIIKKSYYFDEVMIVFKGDINYEPIKNIVSSIYLNDKLVYGKEFIKDKIGNLEFIISPNAFFQVNTKQTYKLYSEIKRLLNLKREDKLLDLYCGSGTIGMFLSDSCKSVLGVEINKYSISDALKNKELNNIQNISFINADASVVKYNDYDAIVVDPPRSGLDKVAVNKLLNSNCPKIVYTSCDPITLKRDLDILTTKYNVVEVTPVDMFPNTYHVECVCLLNKKKNNT